jgi:glyoxylate/hydroxypyruvate reductase A
MARTLTVVLIATNDAEDARTWRQLIERSIPGAECRIHPDIGDPDSVDVVLAWKAPRGLFSNLPNVKLIGSLGMGVDHLLDDPSLPAGVPITRLVDPNMIEQMSEYALYGVLRFHRHFHVYEQYQRERRWQELPLPHTSRRRVGVMGIGEIGGLCARRIAALGFPVSGWSRTKRSIDGVSCLSGSAQLQDFLARSDILVVVLPLTPETSGILNAESLAQLPRGAFVVNLARGALINERDLVAALDSGRLAGALLDVTQIEPLPADSPLWLHSKVKLTPHIAGLTTPETAAATVVENIKRLRTRQPPICVVERDRGY